MVIEPWWEPNWTRHDYQQAMPPNNRNIQKPEKIKALVISKILKASNEKLLRENCMQGKQNDSIKKK